MRKINEVVRGLNEITLMLTDMCTMRCKYCFEHQRDTTKDKIMSLDVLNATLKLISSSKANHLNVQLFGGEPTMNIPALYRICEWLESDEVKSQQIHIEMQSNLFHITDEHINLFKRMNNAKNVCKFWLTTSLDGVREANVNRIDPSGYNTFDAVMYNIRRVKNSIPSIYLTVHSVYTNDNIKYLAQNIDFFLKLKEEGVVDQIGGNWVDPDTNGFSISDESIRIACDQYWNYIQPRYKESLLEDSNMFTLMKLDIPVNDTNLSKMDICGAGSKTLAVMSNGDIVPCHRYIEKYTSHIDHPIILANVLLLDNYNDDVAKLYPPKFDNLTCDNLKCSQCTLSYYCKTCIAANEMYGGSMNSQTTAECSKTIKLLKHSIQFKMKHELLKQRELQNEQIELLQKIDEKMIGIVETIVK